jgi:TRAP-type transport system small permease protein
MRKTEFVKILEFVAFLITIALVFIMFVQVFARQFLPSIPVWSGEETASLLLIWLAMVGAAIAAAKNAHISMDFLFEKIPDGKKPYVEVIVYSVICLFLIGMAIISFQLAWANRTSTTARLNLSMFWIQGSIAFGMSIMFIYYVKHVITSFRKLVRKEGIDNSI